MTPQCCRGGGPRWGPRWGPRVGSKVGSKVGYAPNLAKNWSWREESTPAAMILPTVSKLPLLIVDNDASGFSERLQRAEDAEAKIAQAVADQIAAVRANVFDVNHFVVF